MATTSARRSVRSGKLSLGTLAGVLVFSLGIGAAGAWASPPVRSQIKMSVTREVSPFTELYFTSPTSLPKFVYPAGSNTFDFTIMNHERRAITYRYVVTGESAASYSQAVASGEVTIPSGGATNVPVQFVPAQSDTQYVVRVRLTNRAETIHFGTHS